MTIDDTLAERIKKGIGKAEEINENGEVVESKKYIIDNPEYLNIVCKEIIAEIRKEIEATKVTYNPLSLTSATGGPVTSTGLPIGIAKLEPNKIPKI